MAPWLLGTCQPLDGLIASLRLRLAKKELRLEKITYLFKME